VSLLKVHKLHVKSRYWHQAVKGEVGGAASVSGPAWRCCGKESLLSSISEGTA